MEAPRPKDEAARLAALGRYRILDTPCESDFDELVKLAAQICQTPIALVSLVDRDRQWFKGRYGLEVAETLRRLSFCAHSILHAPAMTEVIDAKQDARFADNELVTGAPGIRFYAGAPLVTPEGHALGTLCVIDAIPRQLTEEQKEALRVLSRQVMTQLELRRSLAELQQTSEQLAAAHTQQSNRLEKLVRERTAELDRANEELRQKEERFRVLAEASFEGIFFHQLGRIVDCNDQFAAILGCQREDLLGRQVTEFFAPEEQELALQGARERRESTLDLHARRKDGSWRVIEVHGRELGQLGMRVATVRDVTDRKETEEALRRSQARLGGILDTAMDAIISIDERQRIVLFNPAAEAIFGLSAREALGRSINELIPYRFRAVHTRYVEEFGRTGSSSRKMGHLGSLSGLRANGQEFPIEASISQVTVAGEELFTVILRDITERKRAEHSLAEKARLLEQSFDAIIVRNAEARIAYWNHGAEEMYGWTAEEVSGQVTHLLLHTEFPKPLEDILEELNREGRWTGELIHTRRDGTRIVVATRWVLDRDQQGRSRSILETNTDITARKHTEEALRQSEMRFRTLAEAMPQLAWIARADGFIFWYNRRWYEYTGTTPEQVEGWGWQSVQDPQMLSKVLERWRGSLASGQPFEMELPLRGAGGQFRPFLTRVMPLRRDDGRVLLWFGTNTDITDIVAAREALTKHHTELERLVVQRTAQLVEANTNLQTFAYTAAHDLRSPLRAIKSFSSIALEECAAQLGSAGHSYLERVVAAATQMERLLSDLLEYSKLSQAEVRLENTNLRKAVSEALTLQEADIRTKKAQVDVEAPMPEVMGHPASIVLIINNFVSNALKFIPSTVQPHIRIWAENSGPFVRLCVQDNGIGIAPENLGKLFNVFQRLHSKQDYPGTGLGLAIVRKGAERMGGRVGVESEPGKGSRFWVELKRCS